MSTPHLGSILIGSTDPDRLRHWYCTVFDVEPDEFGRVLFGAAELLFEPRSDVATANTEPGRLILNFHVPDARATTTRLDGFDADWLVPPEQREHGIFGTIVDADKNYIQIIELTDSNRSSPITGMNDHPYSGFSVDDLAEAKQFYATNLRMSVTDDPAGFWLRASDEAAPILVYENLDHVPGSFTILNLPVVDIDAAVDQLAARGVQFLRYATIDQDPKGIHRGMHRGTGPDIAWFADPAGNVLSVLCEGTA